MKRTKSFGVIALLSCLLLAGLFAMPAFAEEGAEGPLVYTLPEDAAISPGKTFDTYVISWEPPEEEVFRYMVGGFLDGASHMQIIGGGWVGTGYVMDGEDAQYRVDNAFFDSIAFDGDVTEYDFADIVNSFCELDEKTLNESKGCFLSFLIIPQSGEPVTQRIEIPVEMDA